MSKKLLVSLSLLALILVGSFFIYNKKLFLSFSPRSQVAAISGVGSGLIAHWTFDESSGQTVNDTAGVPANTGAMVGTPMRMQSGAAVGSGALTFTNNQSNQASVNVGRVASSVRRVDGNGAEIGTNQISVSAWIKREDPSYQYTEMFVSKQSSANAAWALYKSHSLVFSVFSLDGGFHGQSAQGPLFEPANTEWAHVVGVYNGEEVVLYLNGESGTPVPMTGNIHNYDVDTCISASADGGCTFSGFTGSIDDVRIYDRALTESEVMVLCNMKSGGCPPPPIPPVGGTDTVRPKVSITAPLANATISGHAFQVTADATDAGGILGVTFRVDGSTLIGTDTTEPYSVSLNTFGLSQGTHTLHAVAQDASNNYATSTITVTVSNATDSEKPIISQVASTTLTSSATISWRTNEIASSWIEYGLTSSSLGNSTNPEEDFTEDHSQKITRLLPNTLYHFKIQAKDPQGNIGESVGTFVTKPQSDTAKTIDGSALVKFPTSALWSHDVNFKPGNGERVDMNPPRFSWLYNLDPLVSNCSASSYGCLAWAPKRFVFQIARDINFTNLLVNEPTEFNFYNFIPTLPTETPLYWRVGYILPKNTSDPYTWTMTDDSFTNTIYAYSSTKTFTIAGDATPWDRSMLGRDSYMNDTDRTAHPHIFFNAETRAGLYTWLEEMEDQHLTTGTPQEIGIAQAWNTIKDNARTFESQLTKSDLALNVADMRVQFAKIGPAPGVDFDEVLPKMIQKEYVSPNLYASSQNRSHAFDAEFQGWFPQYDTSAVGTSSSAWSAKLAAEGIAFNEVSVQLIERGYMKEADGKYWVKTKLAKDGFDTAFKSSLPTYTEEKFTKLKATLLSLYSSPFDEMRLVILRSYYHALGTAATPLAGNMRDEPGLDGIQAIALAWQLTKSATDTEGMALNNYIEGKHFEDVTALIAEWFLESKQWAMDTQVSGDPILNRNLGYAYDWFYDELTEAQRQTFRRAIDANIAYTSGEVPGHPIYDRYAKPAKENNSVFYIDPSWSLYRFGASHLAGNSEAAIVGALATYGESPKARRYLDYISNYIIGQTAFTGSSGDMGMGRGYAVGVFFGGGGAGYRYLIDNFMLQIAFPEAGFNKNPFWKTSAEWWSRTTPVGFTQSHEAWGDGEGKRVPMLSDPTMARDLAYFTGDGKMQRHYLNERALLRGTEPSLESFDQLPLLYYAHTNKKGLTVPIPEDNLQLSKLFDYSGWGTGCSAPVNTPDCFLNGVGFEMKASPANHLGVGSNTHTNYAGLSYQLWAYGVPVTDAGQSGLLALSKFSEDHYSIMVDGVGMYQEPFLPNEAVLGRFTAYATSSDYVYFAADATAAYARKSSSNPPFDNSPHRQLKKVQRHFLFVKNKYFVVFDDVESGKLSKFSWLYQVPALYSQVGGSSYETTKQDLFTQDSPSTFSYTAGNTPVTDYFYRDFSAKRVRVKVALMNDPATVTWRDMNGADQRKNPITGRDQTLLGDGHPRARTIWVTNNQDSTKFHFMSVIYPQEPNEAPPTITSVNDYTARVTNADGTIDVISFDPDTAVENGATIVIDVDDLAPLPFVDDVGSAYIPPEPPSTFRTLTITKSGAGLGTITGTGINGLNCATTTCTYQAESGTQVSLNASPGLNSTFHTWGGACQGIASTSNCSVTLNANKSVTATFMPVNNPSNEDEIPPVFLEFQATVKASSAVVTVTTDEEVTSVLSYGITLGYGNITAPTSSVAAATTFTLSGLQPNTTYHYRIVATDASGNVATSTDKTFVTFPYEETGRVVTTRDITRLVYYPTDGQMPIVIPRGRTGTVVSSAPFNQGRGLERAWIVELDNDPGFIDECAPHERFESEGICDGIYGWMPYSSTILDWVGTAPAIKESFLAPLGAEVILPPNVPGGGGSGENNPSLDPEIPPSDRPDLDAVVATTTATITAAVIPPNTPTITPPVVIGAGGTGVVTRGTPPKIIPVPVPAVIAPAPLAQTTLTPVTKTLVIGSTGTDVLSLQTILVSQGLLTTYVKGTFDTSTEAALKAFQKKYGIASSGTPKTTGFGAAGPKTRTKLNSFIPGSKPVTPVKPTTIKPVVAPKPAASTTAAPTTFTPNPNSPYQRTLTLGARGNDVKQLQIFLNSRGYTLTRSGDGSRFHEYTTFDANTKNALMKFQTASGLTATGGLDAATIKKVEGLSGY